MSLNDPIRTIDQWFASKCNGQWEHHEGILIQTTDNPGWLATVNSMSIEREKLAREIGDLLRDHGAQVATDGSIVRVYASSLTDCLNALAKVMNITS